MAKNAKYRKSENFRLLFQIIFTAITNGYLIGFAEGKIYRGTTKNFCVPGLNCYSCPGAIASCPIGSIQAVANSRNFNVSFYMIGFFMIVGAIAGRTICGWMCPFGLVQDLLHEIPFVKKIKTFSDENIMLKLKYLILAVFVIILPMVINVSAGYGKPWFCELICPSGTLFAGIPLVSTNPMLKNAAGLLFSWKVSLLLLIILLSIIIHRPFCKYFCPLGAIYGIFNKFSLYQYKVDMSKCTKCNTCYANCPMNVKIHENATDAECIRCKKCIAICPEKAINADFSEKKPACSFSNKMIK